jgi:LacI family transcriptional regulator
VAAQFRGTARVTLRQIAGELGLSTFAVSRALSGKDGVSETTRQLVGSTATRLGYVRPAPGAAARDIALVFHDLDDVNSELRMQIQNGVQREAHRLARPVRLQWTHLPEQIADLARCSAGLLLVGPHDRRTVETIGAIGVPVVRLGWVDPLEQVDQVLGTDHEAGQAVAEYLIGLGHRAIAFVHGAPGLRGRRERFTGMREVVERRGDITLHQLAFDEQDGFSAAFRTLRLRAAPTAFFCAHDGLALTVMSELLALGYRIPEDASVVGFGDFSPATQISPPLTTVRMEGCEMGAVALRLLLDRIESGAPFDAPARRVLIASRIIERRSSGPLRIIAPGGRTAGRARNRG